ncbi:carbohydrate ABC transporter permease [Halorussus marinus]|uniref:carbohydrate ABC transporter permease n=1 Tax=Halorussus marinus TaxID=2505976 RepID=UPI00106EB0A3|nr:sugar ABC transporter permease [Halorussus marinus]
MGAESGETLRGGDRGGPYAATVRWMENLSETQFAYLLLVPTFLILGLIAFWPLVRTFDMALHADALVGRAQLGEYVGLNNFVELLTGERDALLVRPLLPDVAVDATFPFVHFDNLFVSAISATLIFSVVSVAFETVIGFGQALVLDQDFRGRRWVRVAIIIPWAVPIVIQGMIFYLMFQPGIGFGVDLVQQLPFFSFSETPLANPVDSMVIIIVADVWKTSAFMALLILAGLQSIDRSLYDVARVSGASKWQQFKYITLPLVFPTVMVAMLFRTIAAMRIFGVIETVSGCNVVPSLSCLVVTTFSNRMYGTAAAVAFLTAAIIGALVLVYIYNYATSGQEGI